MTIESNIKQLIETATELEDATYVFLSLGKENIKATVKLLKTSRNLERNVIKQCQNFRKKTGSYPKWIKLDIVTETDSVPFHDIKRQLIETRRNYIDFGLAFDDNWNLTFLPEEINANAFVRPDKQNGGMMLSEANINNYLRKYTSHKVAYKHDTYKGKNVTKFYTQSYISDEEGVHTLGERGYRKTLRKVEDLHSEIDKLITTSVHHLKNEIQENGRFIYGYFPHFDKKISNYNMLRHSSSAYALIEGLAYLGEDTSAVAPAIDYVIDQHIYEKDGAGYVFDDTNDVNEIKLGQNASFIFAVVEYLKHHPDESKYLKAAQHVAKGILNMIDAESGKTTHVLNYPDLSVKETFRIVYYDGEAALALLRLYQVDKDPLWLKTVKQLFEKFIAEDYWKYHDHWLGYCTNELVKYEDDERYFKFGIQNVSGYLDYIHNRETTFPTFLEMLMATYKLIQKAKEMGHEDLVESLINEDYFMETLHLRADYQRTGYFYPEIAMYFKNPQRILGAFFIKHHGYRVRIDDIEHYLSGYVQYQNAFKGESK